MQATQKNAASFIPSLRLSPRDKADELAVWPGDETQPQPAPGAPSLHTLAGGVGHHLNTWLSVILGNTYLIRQQLPADSPLQDLVDHVEIATRSAEDITKQLLLYTRKTQPCLERLNLSALIEDLDDHFKANVHEHIAVECHLDPQLPDLEGDAIHLRRLVLNLFNNAVEAIGDGPGEIALRTQLFSTNRPFRTGNFSQMFPQGDYVWLEIADTGCGMSEEACRRAFEPFFSTKFTGRGLGLSAALGIVREQRGAIWLTTKQGEGTNVHVLLPCADVSDE
jgi:signal transduction histidine kinase